MTTDRAPTTKVHNMHHVPNNTKLDTMARTESESHADTTCAGKNMTLLSCTGYKFNVIGFHSDLKSMEKILVATTVTAYNDPLLVTTVVLVFNQAIGFGSSMVKSLKATNQVCSHGIQLSYDPYDQKHAS